MPVNPYLDSELGDGSGNVDMSQYLDGGQGPGMTEAGSMVRGLVPRVNPYRRGGGGVDPYTKIDSLLAKAKTPQLGQISPGTKDVISDSSDTSANTNLSQVTPGTSHVMKDAANTSANASAGKYIDPDTAFADRLAGTDRGPDKDAGYFARQAEKVISDTTWDVSSKLGFAIPDIGANPDNTPTTAAVARNSTKMGSEMHPNLDQEAQQHARGDRPDFTAYDRATERVKALSDKIATQGIGGKILDFFTPQSQTQAVQLHAAIVNQQIHKQAAIEKYLEDHPEAAQEGKIQGHAPGTIITDAKGNIIRTLPGKEEKPPKEQNKVIVNSGDKRWVEDPNTNTRSPMMEETPDMQGPTPSGAAGYTGTVQAKAADIGSAGTPMERQQAVIDAKKAAAIETKKTTPGKAAPKTPEEIETEAAARERGKASVTAPAKEVDIKGARLAYGKLTPRQKKDPKEISNLETLYGLESGALSGNKNEWISVPGVDSKIRIHPKQQK